MNEGLKTLFAFHQRVRGFGDSVITEEMIENAKIEGYLFDYPSYESHSDTLNRLKNTLSQIDKTDIANAFLFSLSTRRLEYRSALGSYYYAKAIPKHEKMDGYHPMTSHCYLCGWYAWKDEPDELDLHCSSYNTFNYERYKYGGVRHTQLNYALFDLEQFLKLPKVNPCEEDIRIFKDIMSCVAKLEPKDKVGKLRALITKEKVLKSNKDEVSVLLGELGICGILAGNDYPSYDIYFANEYERAPVEHSNDFDYPVNRWYASDGINIEKLREVFGDSFL